MTGFILNGISAVTAVNAETLKQILSDNIAATVATCGLAVYFFCTPLSCQRRYLCGKHSFDGRLRKSVDKNPAEDYYYQAYRNACLAQPVEHAAVNRSVGGSSPSTGARKEAERLLFYFLISVVISNPLRCFRPARLPRAEQMPKMRYSVALCAPYGGSCPRAGAKKETC